jgi:hypothetical protein
LLGTRLVVLAYWLQQLQSQHLPARGTHVQLRMCSSVALSSSASLGNRPDHVQVVANKQQTQGMQVFYVLHSSLR